MQQIEHKLGLYSALYRLTVSVRASEVIRAARALNNHGRRQRGGSGGSCPPVPWPLPPQLPPL